MSLLHPRNSFASTNTDTVGSNASQSSANTNWSTYSSYGNPKGNPFDQSADPSILVPIRDTSSSTCYGSQPVSIVEEPSPPAQQAKDPRIYHCTYCSTNGPWQRKDSWVAHELNHLQASWHCQEPNCHMIARRKREFKDHHKKDHGCQNCNHSGPVRKIGLGKVSFGCGICGDHFGLLDERMDHIGKHYEEGKTIQDWSFTTMVVGLLKAPIVFNRWMTLLKRTGCCYDDTVLTWTKDSPTEALVARLEYPLPRLEIGTVLDCLFKLIKLNGLIRQETRISSTVMATAPRHDLATSASLQTMEQLPHSSNVPVQVLKPNDRVSEQPLLPSTAPDGTTPLNSMLTIPTTEFTTSHQPWNAPLENTPAMFSPLKPQPGSSNEFCSLQYSGSDGSLQHEPLDGFDFDFGISPSLLEGTSTDQYHCFSQDANASHHSSSCCSSTENTGHGNHSSSLNMACSTRSPVHVGIQQMMDLSEQAPNLKRSHSNRDSFPKVEH